MTYLYVSQVILFVVYLYSVVYSTSISNICKKCDSLMIDIHVSFAGVVRTAGLLQNPREG